MNYENVLNSWAGGQWWNNKVFSIFVGNMQDDAACVLAYDQGYETDNFENPYQMGGLAWAIAEYYHALGMENS